MTEIELIDTEIRVVKGLARIKNERNNEVGAVHTRFGRAKSIPMETIDIHAYGAHFAYCKLSNTWPDLTTNPRRKGVDCISYDGVKIDVKQRPKKFKELFLMVNEHKTLEDAEAYVLMLGEMPKFKYLGWCANAEVIKPECLSDRLPGGIIIPQKCYLFPAKRLHKGFPNRKEVCVYQKIELGEEQFFLFGGIPVRYSTRP